MKLSNKTLGLILAVLSLLTAGITGCSSAGSTYTNSAEDGEIVISMTDIAGDFSSYTVDVLSLNLKKANGAEVTTLPLSTRIDFSQYTEMTEFLTAATIPSGTYVAATLTLDFQNADIWVENENGENVQVFKYLDENEDPFTILEVTVELEGENGLTVLPGNPAHLMLDFDLQASNQVNFDDPADPILTVAPFIVAEVDRTHPNKIHRIRGLLDTVNEDENTFSVILRPFYCALPESHRLFGIRTVTTDDDTVFHINGVAYESLEGLEVLGGLDQLTPVVALGSLKFNPLRFEAWEVYAGTSVPGTGFDVVSGWVINRTDDTLTVKGASLFRYGSSVVFNDEIMVQVADTTVVSRQISINTYSKDDISIGQHIAAFGTLIDLDPENPELDATDGYVRMMITPVRGTVVSVDEGHPVAQIILDLQSIGKFSVENYNFTGTGPTSEEDADPDNYEIYTGSMDLSGFAADTPVKLKGFVEPFGMAPPDFSAASLIDVTGLDAFLRVNWLPPTNIPFSEMSAEGLTINLEGTGRWHNLGRGNVLTDLYDLPTAPIIAPDEDGQGRYVLKYEGITEIHTVFEDFVQSLEELLEKGYTVRMTNATGQFDDDTSVLTAYRVEISFGMASPI